MLKVEGQKAAEGEGCVGGESTDGVGVVHRCFGNNRDTAGTTAGTTEREEKEGWRDRGEDAFHRLCQQRKGSGVLPTYLAQRGHVDIDHVRDELKHTHQELHKYAKHKKGFRLHI